MQIQHTPAPFPSTILSLAPNEQFSYKGTTIQAVTLDPTNPRAPYILSGESRIRHNARMFSVLPQLPDATPSLVRAAAARELARYATPAPAPKAHLQAVPSLPATPHTPRKGKHRA